MKVRDIQTAVDALAERLQRSVVINDPHVRMLFASRHFDDEDETRVRAILQRDAGAKAIGHVLAQNVSTWTTAGVIPANASIGMKARVCVPIRWQGVLVGQLMVMDGDESLTTSELSTISQTALEVAPAMAVDAQEENALTVSEQTLLDLIGSEPNLRRRALHDLAQGPQSARFRHVVAVEIGVNGPVEGISESHANSALRSVMAMDYRQRPATRLCGISSDLVGTLLLGSLHPLDESAVAKHAGRMLDRLSDLASGQFKCAVGIGSGVVGLEQSHVAARRAALARRATGPLGVEVASWTELGPFSLLLQVPEVDWQRDLLPHEVQKLLAASLGIEMLSTLRVYLNHAGNGPAASEALHIHRTTLYYRLNRISELADLDLSNGVTRLSLHLGLTMLDLVNDGKTIAED